jgi:WD40 repeat protein
MPIAASCSCGKSFQAKDSLAGKRVRCPACGGIIEIPHLAQTSEDPLGLGDFGASEMNSMPMSSPMPTQSAYGQMGTAIPSKPKPRGGASPVLWICLGVAGIVAMLFVVGVLAAVFLLRGSDEAIAESSDSGGDVASSGTAPVSPAASSSSTAAQPALIDPAASPPPWSVTADPPSQPVKWPSQVDINIPIPEHNYYIRYPATPSPFMVVGLNSIGKTGVYVWDVIKGEKAGEINVAVPSTEFAVSPDGKHLAAKVSGAEAGTVSVYSFESGQKAVDIAYGGDYLQYAAFTSPNSLVTHSWGSAASGYEYAIRVWSVPDGKQQQEIQLKKQFPKSSLVPSPGGRYLAVMEGDKLSVFDLQEGKLAGYELLEQLAGESLGSYYGMSFSPDGKQLGVVYAGTNSRVVFLDATTGKIAETISFAGKPPTASAYPGDSIEWLGDRGWCLFGGTVIDRKTQRLVWNLDVPTIAWMTPRRTLAGGWIVQAGPHARTSLRFLPMPTTEIDASLAALEEKTPAHLRPGSSVSLEIAVGKLRAGTPEDTQKRLSEIFTERFQGDKISVADGQPLVLKVEYSETEGSTLTERKGIAGPATGRTVQSTKIHLKMTLVSSDGSESFFTDEIETDPHGVTVISKELNEANVRDSVFRQLLYSLSATPIPYFVPQHEGMSKLPGVTEFP